MEKYEIEKLRSLPIEGVAERLGMTVSHHKTLCPFHGDKHPSLSFHQKSNTFKCFVCDAHGDVITLAQKVLGKSFLDTCHWLAQANGIYLEDRQDGNHEGIPTCKREQDQACLSLVECSRDSRKKSPVKKGSTTQTRGFVIPSSKKPPMLDLEFLRGLVSRPTLIREAEAFLFEERHLRPEVIEWIGISSISSPAPCWRFGRRFYDAPSLLIPYRDLDGNIQNVQSRYLGYEQGKPRFRFPSGSSIHVFNLPMLRHLSPGEPLYISEGVTDCLALLSAGHKAIAIPSATLLKPQDLEILKRVPALQQASTPLMLHIYPDQDEAGERLYRQLTGVCTQLGFALIRHQLPEGCKDFSDYYLMKIKNY